MKAWIVVSGEHYETGFVHITMHTDRDAAIEMARNAKAPIMSRVNYGLYGTVEMREVNTNPIGWSEVYGFDFTTNHPFEKIEDHEL